MAEVMRKERKRNRAMVEVRRKEGRKEGKRAMVEVGRKERKKKGRNEG